MISKWNDQMSSRERNARAVLVTEDGKIHFFNGQSIPDVCHATIVAREKNGKWSNCTYDIVHRDTTGFVSWMDDFDTGKAFPQPTLDAAFAWFAKKAPMVSFAGFMELSTVFRKTFSEWQERIDAEKAFSVGRTQAHLAETAAKLKAIVEAVDAAKVEVANLGADVRDFKRCFERNNEVLEEAKIISGIALEIVKECVQRNEERAEFMAGPFSTID